MGTVMMLSNVIHHTLLSAKKSSADVLLILLERFSTQVVFLGYMDPFVMPDKVIPARRSAKTSKKETI